MGPNLSADGQYLDHLFDCVGQGADDEQAIQQVHRDAVWRVQLCATHLRGAARPPCHHLGTVTRTPSQLKTWQPELAQPSLCARPAAQLPHVPPSVLLGEQEHNDAMHNSTAEAISSSCPALLIEPELHPTYTAPTLGSEADDMFSNFHFSCSSLAG